MKTTRLDTRDSDFIERLSALTAWSEERDEEVGERVRAILRDVAGRGDAAVVEYTNRFDRREAESLADLTVERDQLEAALARLPAEQRDALQAAAERVRDYHERQKQESWSYRDAHGTLLGQQVTALDRAGIYVPGGKAAYPSSVLMNALPAHVAGVGEIVMVSPAPDGELDDMVLAAAAVAGVERFFTVGGAQAVAALAFGTESIPAVDKIVGPGNIYVAEAKRQVFGKVGIDMIAGPSEILVVCDGHTDPDWIAMDLFSQAEHDEEAQAILVSPDADFLERVAEAMERLAPTLEREAIIRTSMANRGALILARDLDDAFEVVNRISPEHLELSMDDAGRWAKKCATPAPSSWVGTPRKPWAITAPGPTMCCPPAPRRAFPRRWASMISEAQFADRLFAGGRQRSGRGGVGAGPGRAAYRPRPQRGTAHQEINP